MVQTGFFPNLIVSHLFNNAIKKQTALPFTRVYQTTINNNKINNVTKAEDGEYEGAPARRATTQVQFMVLSRPLVSLMNSAPLPFCFLHTVIMINSCSRKDRHLRMPVPPSMTITTGSRGMSSHSVLQEAPLKKKGHFLIQCRVINKWVFFSFIKPNFLLFVYLC